MKSFYEILASFLNDVSRYCKRITSCFCYKIIVPFRGGLQLASLQMKCFEETNFYSSNFLQDLHSTRGPDPTDFDKLSEFFKYSS